MPQPYHARSRLGISEVEMALAIAPSRERHDLITAAFGQKQKADDRHMRRPTRFVTLQYAPGLVHFLFGSEVIPSLPSIAPEALARIASFRSASVVLRTGYDDRKDRYRPVGGDRSGVVGSLFSSIGTRGFFPHWASGGLSGMVVERGKV